MRLHSKLKRASRRRRGGFTLIELLVVLVILGLLVGVATPFAIRYLGSAKTDVAAIQLENFSVALNLFRIHIGRYPTSEEGLSALVRTPAGLSRWRGPYLDGKEVPKDPWDNPYIYQRLATDSNSYTLLSRGADGIEGGEGENADITRR